MFKIIGNRIFAITFQALRNKAMVAENV